MFEKSIQTLSFFIVSIVTIVLGIFFEKLQTTISIPLWILILIGLVVIYLTLIILKTERKNKKLNENITLSKKSSISKRTTKNPRKSISEDFVIDKINIKYYEWSVLVRRSWLPANKPDAEKFSKEVFLNKPICKYCCCDLFELEHNSKLYLICPSEDCKSSNFEPLTIGSINRTSEIELKVIRGVIRKNFDKYWNIYVKKYDDFTNKKYDEFWEPI